MTSKFELDPRIDPRVRAFFAGIDLGSVRPNVSSRKKLLAQEDPPAYIEILPVIGRSTAADIADFARSVS
jgi:hypothetical protein